MTIALAAAVGAGPAGRWPRPTATEPPAPAGTVAYNEWLGVPSPRCCSTNRPQDARVAILDRIVAEDYIQHNPLVPKAVRA